MRDNNVQVGGIGNSQAINNSAHNPKKSYFRLSSSAAKIMVAIITAIATIGAAYFTTSHMGNPAPSTNQHTSVRPLSK